VFCTKRIGVSSNEIYPQGPDKEILALKFPEFPVDAGLAKIRID
jgi:hypothetical protein